MKKVDLYKKFKVSKRALELLNSHNIGLDKRIPWEKAGWITTMKCNFLCDLVKSDVRFSVLLASSCKFIFNYVSYFDAKENRRVFTLVSWSSKYNYLNYTPVKIFVDDYLSTKKYVEEVLKEDGLNMEVSRVVRDYKQQSNLDYNSLLNFRHNWDFSHIESPVDSDQSTLLNFGHNWDGDTANKETN